MLPDRGVRPLFFVLANTQSPASPYIVSAFQSNRACASASASGTGALERLVFSRSTTVSLTQTRRRWIRLFWAWRQEVRKGAR